jgi:hypothetical protein
VTLPDASCAGTKNLLVFEPSAPAQRLQEAIRDSGDFLAALTENCVDVLPWAQQDSWRDEQYMLWLLLAAHACFTAAFLLLLWKAAALLREPKDPATPARLLE